VPGENTKLRRDLLVPLPAQALAILEELRPLTDRGPESYLLPAIGRKVQPISENTLNQALRRLGFGPERMCTHGFRSSASTLLHELGWAPDLVELQLGHAIGGVRGIYNRAQRLDERRGMMEAWSGYLDTLRDGDAKVVALRRGKHGR